MNSCVVTLMMVAVVAYNVGIFLMELAVDSTTWQINHMIAWIISVSAPPNWLVMQTIHVGTRPMVVEEKFFVETRAIVQPQIPFLACGTSACSIRTTSR